MDFTPNRLEDSRIHFRDILRKLTPSEEFYLYQFLFTLIDYLLKVEGRQ